MSEREREYAKMEAQSADAEMAYFSARSHLLMSSDWARRVFSAAFQRGWDAARPQRPNGLTDEEISIIANGMPDGMAGFMKGWGWQQFAREIERAILGDEP